MGFSLAPAAASEGYRLQAHESVGSTNVLALEQARAGDPGRLWIAARSQESGRGRRGRQWATPPGNLAATLLLSRDLEPRVAATLGFVAGLSLADALDAAAPALRLAIAADAGGTRRSRFELKWPNDVLADGAKLAGILLESEILQPYGFAVAIGIGVNVAAYPADLPYPATSLAALGAICDAEALFAALSDAWCSRFREWDGGRGLATTRRSWLDRAAGLGGDVAVKVDGSVLRGRFETIDEEGRFVIRADDGGLIGIAAGDVHFGVVASATAG